MRTPSLCCPTKMWPARPAAEWRVPTSSAFLVGLPCAVLAHARACWLLQQPAQQAHVKFYQS